MFAGFNPPQKKNNHRSKQPWWISMWWMESPHLDEIQRFCPGPPPPCHFLGQRLRRRCAGRPGDGEMASTKHSPPKKNEKRGKVMYQNASLLCCIRFYFSPVDPVSFRGRVKRTMFSSIYYQDSSKTGGAMEHRHASSLQNIVTVSSSQVSAGTWTDLRHVLRLRKPNNQRIR